MIPPFSQESTTKEQARFQWQAMVRPAAFEEGWQDHLTSYLFAVATVPVSGKGPILPTMLQVQVAGKAQDLYQVRMREGAVDVWVAYPALARLGVGLTPACELLIRTTDGVQSVTLDPPAPPGQEDWQDIVEQFWSRLQAEEELRLDWGIAPYQPGQSGVFLPQRMLLSRFRLAPDLQWEDMPPHLLRGDRLVGWQRELRLVRDAVLPWLLHAQVGWRAQAGGEEVPVAPPLLPEEEPEADLEPEVLSWEQEFAHLRDDAGMPAPAGLAQGRLLKPPSPTSIDWRGLLRQKGGLLLAGALLLVFIGLGTSVLAFGVLGGNPQAGPSATTIAQASPTSAAGNQSSPVSQPTSDATSTFSAAPSPTAKATSTPTATAVVNWSVATQGSTSQRCSPPHPAISPLILIIDNSKSTAALTWQVTISDMDPAGKVWATASPTSGTVPAGQQAQTTLTPISSLCQDLAGSKSPASYHAVVSGSAAGQSKQVTITVTVKP
jgi:hypothetical protein